MDNSLPIGINCKDASSYLLVAKGAHSITSQTDVTDTNKNRHGWSIAVASQLKRYIFQKTIQISGACNGMLNIMENFIVILGSSSPKGNIPACAPFIRSHLWLNKSRTLSCIIADDPSSTASSVSPSLFPLSVPLWLKRISSAPSISAIFFERRFLFLPAPEVSFGAPGLLADTRLYDRASSGTLSYNDTEEKDRRRIEALGKVKYAP
ncbi:epsilon-trimethyllysine 2-oxoglutaratedioxygenase [Striga asiatica]|uniref:Epsilon-trimethyllysine 2-oxoglutaratedioxygenase n=1 Tax=Striga asiatica TaxID=4170 RepID=A0A5A7Q4B5_STRAF|nr:epsilon-trimethyllysine 2-oxoglutaratedioxygenase [Striga asiatica]